MSHSSLAIPVIAGLIAGVVLIAIMSQLFYFQPGISEFDPSSSNDVAHMITYPKEEGFDHESWLVAWADDNNAEIITIRGHKAAVHGTQLALRGDQLVLMRGELMALDDKFIIEVYGFVPKSTLIKAAEAVLS